MTGLKLLNMAWLTFVMLLVACNPAMTLELQDTTESKYTVAHLWSYHTRAGEEQSRLTVVIMETINRERRDEVFMHIFIEGLII
jgi:hypothetical protein